MPSENPVVVIPGMFGSSLENFFELEPRSAFSESTLVSAALRGIDPFSIALDASGSVDASLQVTMRSNGLLTTPYSAFVRALRARRAAPVYLFPYDWRRSTANAASLLAQFCDDVRVKAAGLPGWSGHIDFVTHSLGGLVFRSYLAQEGDVAGHVGQVVFIAVPQRGILDAAEAMIRGRSFLLADRKELRKIARTFPSLYELLPTYDEAVVDSITSESVDLFEIENWQQNVTPLALEGAEPNGFDVTQERLDRARAQQHRWVWPTDVVPASDILTLYGADRATTLAQVVKLPANAGTANWYDFDTAARGPGDGIVYESSALLPEVASIRLSREDASWLLETSARINLHSYMPALDEAQTIVSRFLAGERSARGLLPRGLGADRYHVPA